jgi:hypothetical protein
MILFALIAIWLLLIAFVAALCRIAAATDDRSDNDAGRYPSCAVQGSEAKLPGRIAREGRLAPAERELGGVRVRGVRGRGGWFVA